MRVLGVEDANEHPGVFQSMDFTQIMLVLCISSLQKPVVSGMNKMNNRLHLDSGMQSGGTDTHTEGRRTAAQITSTRLAPRLSRNPISINAC